MGRPRVSPLTLAGPSSAFAHPRLHALRDRHVLRRELQRHLVSAVFVVETTGNVFLVVSSLVAPSVGCS
jgi:hypothetical protein